MGALRTHAGGNRRKMAQAAREGLALRLSVPANKPAADDDSIRLDLEPEQQQAYAGLAKSLRQPDVRHLANVMLEAALENPDAARRFLYDLPSTTQPTEGHLTGGPITQAERDEAQRLIDAEAKRPSTRRGKQAA
jgi:hypothetical protein